MLVMEFAEIHGKAQVRHLALSNHLISRFARHSRRPPGSNGRYESRTINLYVVEMEQAFS